MRTAFFIVALFLLLLIGSAQLVAQDAIGRDKILMRNGRTFVGKISKLDQYGNVEFAMPGSGNQLTFSITEITALRFAADTRLDSDAARREFIFRLIDETRVTGRIVACDGVKFTLESDSLGRFEIAMSAVTYIITNHFANITGLQNDGPGCLFALKNGGYVRGELIPPAPAEKGGRLTEFKYKANGQTRVLPLAEVCGLVMPAPKTRPAHVEGWYARIYLANCDFMVGTLEAIGEKKIKLTTPYMGTIEIGREYLADILFTPTSRATYGRTLVCSSKGQVAEYNELMEPVWSYASKRPCYATLLDNGNILVCDSVEKTVSEIDRRGKVVWQYKGVSDLTTALRMPNGNTIIPEYSLGAGRCLVVGPDGTEIARIFDIGRGMARESDSDNQKVRVRDISLLPNGNLLIFDMINYATSRVVEAEPTGKVVGIRAKNLTRAVATRQIASGEVVVLSMDGNNRVPSFELVVGKDASPLLLDINRAGLVRMISLARSGNIVFARGNSRVTFFEEYEITRNATQSVVMKLVSTRKLNANPAQWTIYYECN